MRRAALCMLLLLGPSARALAQAPDDWEVKRSPFDARVVARYEAALDRDPDDALALRKLTELYKKHRTLDELLKKFKAKQSWQGRAVYADLLAQQLGKTAEAIAVLKAAPPGQAAIDARLGALERKAGHEQEARAAYERALAETRSAPARKPLLRVLADIAVAARDFAAARKYYDELTALEPQDLRLRLEFAEALDRHGEPKARVIEELERAEKIVEKQGNPQLRAEVLGRIGETQEAAGQDDRAVATYKKALALLSREHYMRRELTDKIIGVYRRRDDLRGLAAQYEKEWTQKGFFEWDTLARLYEELGALDKAEAAFRRAIAEKPSALEARTRFIALLDRLGRDDEALREYEKLIALAPSEPRFQIALAERLLRRGEKKRGLELLGRMRARFAGDSSVHAALADLYERYGEADLALKEAERLVALEPDDEGHLVALGEQHFQRGNKKKAVEVWKKLLNVIPKKEQALARLGDLYADHDMAQEALELYEKAAKLAPKDANIQRGIAQVLERQRRIDEAVAAWEKVVQLATDPATRPLKREARSRIISLLAKERRLAARLGPYLARFAHNDAEAGYFLAEAYTKLGQLDQAEHVLRQLLKTTPDDEDALMALVQVLRGRHALGEAIATLRKLAELKPARAKELYTQIADLSLLLYHDDEAVQFARRAVELAPHDAAAHLRLAEIFEKKDDLPAAAASYRNALAENPRLWKAYFALARLYIRAGQLKEAAQLLRDVIARAPEDEVVLDAAHKGIDLEEYMGTLGELEKAVRPLEFAHAQKPVYRRVLLDLYARYAPPLVARAGRGDPAAQAALRGLGEHGLKPLLEGLEDPDARGQAAAANILGYLGNRAAAPALLRLAAGALTGDPPQKPDIDVRVAATLAAGRLADPRSVPQLVKLMADREVALRAAAAWGLGRVRDQAAEKALLQAATSDSKPEVAAIACFALSGQRGPKLAQQLAALARDSERDDLVRAGCAHALGRLGDASALPALLALLESGSGEALRAAAFALGLLGERSAEPALVRAVFVKRDPVRETALYALSSAPHRGPPPPPELDTESGKPDARAFIAQLSAVDEAARTEIKLAPGPALRAVQPALKEALGRHRDLVLRTLRDLDGEDTVIALGPLGAPPEAAEIVASLQPELTSLSGHSDPGVRLHAMRLLAKLGAQPAEPAIERALGEPDLNLTRAAAVSVRLYMAKAPARADALAQQLSEHLHAAAWAERAAAARALGAEARVARSALPALIAAADDEAGFVREAACAALGAARDGRARPILERKSADPAPAVREAATRALANIP